MSKPLIAAAAVSLVLLAWVALAQPVAKPCTSYTSTCTSGTCTGLVPDAGTASGISLSGVLGYYLEVCPVSGQTLLGAGTLHDYHCRSATGTCPEVVANKQTITAATTAAAPCWRSPDFEMLGFYPGGDRMTWAASGVTVSTGTLADGGVDDQPITTYICPFTR